LDSRVWAVPPRMPLGETYGGTCQARSGEVFRPAEHRLRQEGNCGYARGICERFPPEAEGDAVRFSILSHEAGVFRLVWVLEAEHVPLRHGILERSAGGADEDLLDHQADAFVRSLSGPATIRASA
jgi:hypothetical protein